MHDLKAKFLEMLGITNTVLANEADQDGNLHFYPRKPRLSHNFSPPVLLGNTFIARMDAKTDHKQKMLLVHNIHFEEVGLTRLVLRSLLRR